MTADHQGHEPLLGHVQRYDVVVVGAGPAGIAAACAAAESGAQVAVLDSSPWLGGQIWHETPQRPAEASAKRWISRLRASQARVFSGCTVFATGESKSVRAETPKACFELPWNRLILATGARELLIPFPGWTLPGVVGAGGLQALAKGGWPVAGKRIVLAGSGPLLLAAADGLKQQGANVLTIAEQTPWRRVMRFGLQLLRYPGKLRQGLAIKSRLLLTPYRCGCWPLKAEGDGRVERVVFTNGARTWTVACDYLACGFGLVPNTELAQLLRCDLHDQFVKADQHQETTVPGVFCAGEPTGIGGAECAVLEGQIAGHSAVGNIAAAQALFAQRRTWHRFRARLAHAFALRAEISRLARPETIVCRCEDVRRQQLDQYPDWRTAKLQTRCGMGACQGRVCGAATSVLFGWTNDSVRPPIHPVRMETLAHYGDCK